MATKHPIQLFCLLLVITMDTVSTHTQRPSETEQEFYTAAVVEFTPNITLDVVDVLTPQEALRLMMYNLRSFEGFAKEAKEKGADIVVFPEDGIYGFLFLSRNVLFPFLEEIPDPHTRVWIPCGDASFSDRPVLTYLSCLAQRNQITLVTNMGDKQKCHNSSTGDPTPSGAASAPCPPNGWYQYNTNVVFNSDGSLLAKYHKAHLYSSEMKIFDTPIPTPHVIFNTSFGVTFGTFTCYDILYCDPPLELLKMGVRNFIFPTAWGNSYPFYTSIAFQQAWSWRTGSNFLAANQHFPNKHSFPVDIRFYLTGSGIYSAGNALQTFISGENFPPATGKMLLATLQKQPSQMIVEKSDTQKVQEVTSVHVGDGNNVSDIAMRRNTYLNYTALGSQLSDILRVSYTNPDIPLHLECSLEYSRKEQYVTNETYALGAYIGGSRSAPERISGMCSLVKCASSELDTCGSPVDGYVAQTVFETIKLSGSFPDGSVVFPVLLLNELELVSPADVVLGERDVTMDGTRKPLLSANLWGRVQPSHKEYCSNEHPCPNTHK